MDNSLNYQNSWSKPGYIEGKQKLFERMDAYIGRAPRRILDIGCGFAKTSELFQKKYGSELYLLESDIGNSPGQRIGKWGTAESFQWYLPIERLKQAWDDQGMTYTLVDGANLQVSADVKFDLVYSWLSCGFHYPVSTYRDFIKQHTTPDSIIIMDFRGNLTSQQRADLESQDYEVVKVVEASDKKRTLHIRFK
jgi:SAM-dependent methyltransferase